MQKTFVQQLRLSASIKKALTTQSYKTYQYKSKDLLFYERGHREAISGIRATIFGATGFIGPFVGQTLGTIGSDLIFPHNHLFIYDTHVKELPLCGVNGYVQVVKGMDFNDLDMIDRVIKNSNVVINLIGPSPKVKKMEEAEFINITIPKRIAEACAKNPNVLRFIQFSACGADPRSESIDLRTKFHGEEEVFNAFPNATVFRPTTVYGLNDLLLNGYFEHYDFFYDLFFVTDDCKAKRQPICVYDIGQCVLNALKLPETAGKIYELGGPHIYTRLELYEIMHNFIQKPPKIIYFSNRLATWIAQRIPNWKNFSLDLMIKDKIDIVVSEKANTIKDLYVRPVSFPFGIQEFLDQHRAVKYDSSDVMEP